MKQINYSGIVKYHLQRVNKERQRGKEQKSISGGLEGRNQQKNPQGPLNLDV